MLSAGLLIVIVSSGKEGVRAGALSCPPTISVPGRGLCSKKVGKTFSEFLNDPKSYITIDYNPERDDDALGMAFDPKRADDRKEWVAII